MKKFILSTLEVLIMIFLISMIILTGFWAVIVGMVLDAAAIYGLVYLGSIVTLLTAASYWLERKNK
jgi:hypothetical protein